jgi:hypothetical protein
VAWGGGARVSAFHWRGGLFVVRGSEGRGGGGGEACGCDAFGVAEQAAKYPVGLPDNIPHVTLPLPFLYESTGVETYFRDERDPEPRSWRAFTFHRPEMLAEWIETPPQPSPNLADLGRESVQSAYSV